MTSDTHTMGGPDVVTRHVIGQVVNSIVARDWASLEASIAPDVLYWRPGTGDRIDGAEAYVSEWRRFVEAAAELEYRPHTVLVQGDTAMVEASAEGRYEDGSRLAFSVVSVMRVAGGRMVEEREYIVPRA